MSPCDRLPRPALCGPLPFNLSAPSATAPAAGALRSLDYSVLQQCMHCGMCLPTCPTYVDTLRERHSPRGRIALMRAVADGELPVDRPLAEELEYCLGCLACQTACPAGVDYATMLESGRADAESAVPASARPGGWRRAFWRWFAMRLLFTRPRLLRLAGAGLRLWQRSGAQAASRRLGLTRLLPSSLRQLEPQTPTVARRFSHQLIRPVESPSAPSRFRVGMLTGCVQDLVFADVNRDTVDVLLSAGCEVITPPWQPCCGSLHAHNGDPVTARVLARRLLDQFDLSQLDAVISNAGGCGSHLKRLHHLFEPGDPDHERAKRWDAKLRDVHEWLAEIGWRPPVRSSNDPPVAAAPVVTYHDSCHLCHGQKVTGQPRVLLGAVAGIELRTLAESTWCCGAAGIYSMLHPQQAGRLLQRKLDHIEAGGADVLATANPGCHLQIQQGAAARGLTLRVVHPVTLLAEACREAVSNPRPEAGSGSGA